MLGAIIGDIIGSRFEFNNTKSTDFELFTNECTYTDDTICTVAIAYAIKKGISFKDSLLYWCRKYPYPKGGYGSSFSRWIHSDDPQPYNSFGNGSAMRVSPCGWLIDDRSIALKVAKESAECTHNHPEGIKAAKCITDCIYEASIGETMSNIKKLATKKYGYNLNMTCDSIRKTNTFNETCQVTVPQALTCFLESQDFEHAIRLAVSIGGDSDTIAAITGSVAGACYPIPKWIKEKAMSYLPAEFIHIMN